MNSELQYHIQLKVGDVGRYVFLPGDPGRVPLIASRFANPHPVASNREFNTWAGTLEGEPVAATSTGIGGPSAAIALEELSRIGCTTFLRLGTCGALQEKVSNGDLIVPAGSVRGGATGLAYVPLSYPAVADLGMQLSLVEAATALQQRFHSGLIHCKDAFYLEETERLPARAAAKAEWETWCRAGVLATEMESDTLFVLGTLLGLRVGTLLQSVGGLFVAAGPEQLELPDPTAIGRLIDCGVEAMRRIIRRDRQEGGRTSC
ncbi:MAG: nucleoside phosphorylase [Deltaproteobacteria bacterium]|nr:nucleoside phosphorylase [Deltaproteobacteria bacterium]